MEFGEVFGKIVLEKLIAFQPSPEPQNEKKAYVAVFTGKLKDTPATIQIYDINNLQQPKAKKCLYDADECTFKFNFDGSALLAVTMSDVDKSGKSYYGSNKLFFFSSDRNFEGELVSTDEAHVHDVQWNPVTSEFLVARGSMSPEVILYDGKTSKGKTSYGNLRRNTIRWCPFGCNFLIGGFGNLPGDVHIIDYTKNKVIGAAKIPCAVQCEFAPDGRYFLAATTTPRLRVDNCVKIYRYNGDLMHKADFNELYFVSWRMNKGYKYRSPSVGREPASINSAKISNEKSTAIGGDKIDSSRSGIVAALMRQERAFTEIPKISSLQNIQSQNQSVVVGGAPEKLSKSAIRNARRKKGKAGKLKDNETEVEAGKNKHESHQETFKKPLIVQDSVKEATIVGKPEKKTRNKKKSVKTVENNVQESFECFSAQSYSNETKTELNSVDSLKKKVKTLKKKLNDIDKLKVKENLNVEQKAKLNLEENLKKNLNELQEKMKKFEVKIK